jgi:hypothetical protein
MRAFGAIRAHDEFRIALVAEIHVAHEVGEQSGRGGEGGEVHVYFGYKKNFAVTLRLGVRFCFLVLEWGEKY